MSFLYITTSKNLKNWGLEVGLGSALYKMGISPSDDMKVIMAQCTVFDDWKICATRSCDSLGWPQSTPLSPDNPNSWLMYCERLMQAETLIDPRYYPKIQTCAPLFKINIKHVETALLLNFAEKNLSLPQVLKVKPADIVAYILSRLQYSRSY